MTTEPTNPPIVMSADNTVLVLFPPDVLESTKPVVGGDCGVSIRIYDLSPMGARVRVDSYLGQEPNDTVALNLNGQPNIASTQTASTDDSVFMYISKKLLRPEFVNRLTYTVTRRSQNIGTSEPPLEILYNAIRPGIEDRIHGDDGHSELELILPRDVLDDGIDADRAAQGVQVCFSYPYCRAYDKIWLNCNGQDVYRDVTAAEAPAIPSAEPTRICVTVDKAVFERAGDHPQFVFSYTVTDQLGNGPDTDSPWSASWLVDVYLKTDRLVAPDMAEDPDDPGDDPKTIDLNKLGSKDLTVLVHAFAPIWQPDDIIRVKYSATPTTGAVVEHSVEATVLRIPFTYKLMVPNAKVIAESTVRAMYELVRGGEVIASSRNATARVVGESKIEINAPTLVPPATSPIDPLAHPSGVQVQVQVEFSGASPGDEARLVAVNALPGSLPFSMLPLDPDHRAVFTLDAAFLGLWHGKQPQLRWDLIRNGEVIAQSSALVLTINRIAHEDPRLTMPVIVGHPEQILEVAKLLATDKLSIKQWPLQTKDIPVWLRFDGILANGQSDFRIIWSGQIHRFEPSDLVISLTAVLVNWLKSLKDDSEVTITFAVNFDKVVDAVTAVFFPLRRYTVSATPALEFDESPVTLDGKTYFFPAEGGVPNFNLHNSIHRQASEGVGGYTYYSDEKNIAHVTEDGFVTARGNGSTRIRVEDDAKQEKSFIVTISGVVECVYLGNSPFQKIQALAAAKGARLMTLNELKELYADYLNVWPLPKDHYWSTDRGSSVTRYMMKNFLKDDARDAEQTDGGYGVAIVRV
ncbi:MAG: hypothetical protein ABWY46_06730 [Pseudomonas sp.]